MRIDISVLSGPHMGASAQYDWSDRTEVTLGQARDCDVVLSLSDLPDHALTLYPCADKLTVRSEAVDICVKDRGLLPCGMESDLEVPVKLAIGETVLAIHDADAPTAAVPPTKDATNDASRLPPPNGQTPATAAHRSSRWRLFGPLTAMLAGFGGAFLYHFVSALPADGSQLRSMSPLAPLIIGAEPAALPVVSRSERFNAARTAQQDLQDTFAAKPGLEGLGVTVRDDALLVEGTIEEGARTTWLEVRQWFDRVHGPSVTLRSQVQFAPPAPAKKMRPPRIQAVWPGPNPLVTIEGQQFGVGAEVRGGWRIRAIDASSTVFEFDGELITIEY